MCDKNNVQRQVDRSATTIAAWGTFSNRLDPRGLPNCSFASATLLFVERTRPYCVRIVSLKPQELDRGEQMNRAALRAFVRCLKSGQWPGPGGVRRDAEEIWTPDWYKEQIEARLAAFKEDEAA